ncbi:hypothetical protein MRY87_03940 [bacterium]|nr:hypothetical protein [bacterium]
MTGIDLRERDSTPEETPEPTRLTPPSRASPEIPRLTDHTGPDHTESRHTAEEANPVELRDGTIVPRHLYAAVYSFLENQIESAPPLTIVTIDTAANSKNGKLSPSLKKMLTDHLQDTSEPPDLSDPETFELVRTIIRNLLTQTPPQTEPDLPPEPTPGPSFTLIP